MVCTVLSCLSAEVLRDVDVAALQESGFPEYLLLVPVKILQSLLKMISQTNVVQCMPVVDEADLNRAVPPELGSVVDAAHAAHRDVPPDVQLLLEDVSHLGETISHICY